MTSVGAYEAKTHLSALLERVAKGESITITKHGVPVAVIGPATQLKGTEMTPDEAVAEIRQIRAGIAARGVRVSKSEIKEWIEEGRR